ncbi:MAG: biliverdin-producing heme oxygenase, partial [Alphaproteobacteria bacterium]
VHAGAVAIGLPSLARAAAERAERLRADLADLGAVPGPAPARSVAPASDGRAVGCLYVVEGSTLGGRLIHRRLAGLLPGEEGRRYFAGGADDVERWPVFCAALEAFGAGGNRLPDIVLGARQAFATFRDCLEADR